ncbi:hypothetical protein AA0242T_2256 [Acetobacter aceti NRIC 0242]|nr:hypothetical protein EDC15_12412 [Acetobacter aceti NBRC 14818]GAN56256.1 hypothetical protein Abac_004_028 [Acetobacter aceti NBRC 14818]GBO81554.1 hypothetical protein AA0242T_2256 [Acetobacter aceti NRIC 0242]
MTDLMRHNVSLGKLAFRAGTILKFLKETKVEIDFLISRAIGTDLTRSAHNCMMRLVLLPDLRCFLSVFR